MAMDFRTIQRLFESGLFTANELRSWASFLFKDVYHGGNRVMGMWKPENRPADLPAHIPFGDPNNASGKQKKDELEEFVAFLLQKKLEDRSDVPNTILGAEAIIPNQFYPAVYLRPIDQYLDLEQIGSSSSTNRQTQPFLHWETYEYEVPNVDRSYKPDWQEDEDGTSVAMEMDEEYYKKIGGAASEDVEMVYGDHTYVRKDELGMNTAAQSLFSPREWWDEQNMDIEKAEVCKTKLKDPGKDPMWSSPNQALEDGLAKFDFSTLQPDDMDLPPSEYLPPEMRDQFALPVICLAHDRKHDTH